WNQRSRGRCRYRLEVEGLCDRFPDNLNINLYRIVQESLTNATRHGDPAEVVVRISCGESIELTIDDDGRRDTAHPAEPGHGVLGMHERVQALGGIFSLSSRDSGGTRVKANIPLAAAAGASP
ncbi:MAG TPA: sensor histidine kinase, partial [Rhodocyclaceae bacterium]|nr:sensor histidine kinase [Rhodocyclaceae bacterium]